MLHVQREAAVGIARGRLRVIAGAGSNSTSQAIELTRRAEALHILLPWCTDGAMTVASLTKWKEDTRREIEKLS